jgi:exodeoxyribonuclease VII large subunit
VIATRASLVDRLSGAESKLRQGARLELALASQRLHRVFIDESRLRHAVGRRLQKVDDCEYRLRDAVRSAIERRVRRVTALRAAIAQRNVRLQLADTRRRLQAADTRLEQILQRKLGRVREALAPVQAHLVQLSPLKVLERGYAIVERTDGTIVKSPTDAPAKSTVRVRVAAGEFKARVLPPQTPPDPQS